MWSLGSHSARGWGHMAPAAWTCGNEGEHIWTDIVCLCAHKDLLQIVDVTWILKTFLLVFFNEQRTIGDIINLVFSLPPIRQQFSPPLPPLCLQKPVWEVLMTDEGFRTRSSSVLCEVSVPLSLQIQPSRATRTKRGKNLSKAGVRSLRFCLKYINRGILIWWLVDLRIKTLELLNALFFSVTFMLFPGISGSPLRVVTPGDEGKLRLGGGGGGDLEGFSVRYRGTVSSSENTVTCH